MSATPKTPANALPDLYEVDETAWLDAMSELVAQRRASELDYAHLSEYLSDMARRDRREVKSRFVALFVHRLRWNYQSDKRTGSWQSTIIGQREKLRDLLECGTLRNHSEVVLEVAYAVACQQVAAETGLPIESFPTSCPFSVEDLLAE